MTTVTRTGISPITGWTRETWAALADRMLSAVRPLASPGHARITLPGPPGGLGSVIDGLEGFARTFLLAGFRLAGEDGRDPGDLAAWYAEGLAAGTDPGSPERWPRPDEHPQAKVEAASIALILDLTRPWLWDLLPDAVRQRTVAYLAPIVGDDTYPRCNWLWFRIVVETFLRSVGGPWRAGDIEADLAAHESFYRSGGWYADGDERAYDHYAGWAMHLYPVLWARMRGARDLVDRSTVDTRRLDRFLRDYLRLIGADGSPMIQGRSLVYRFAAAAPLWAGALAGVRSIPPGRLRRAASGMVTHFGAHGVPDERDLLTLGWHRSWPRMAQSYSGPSSPYWAAKGMLGLALPAEHPVWQAVEEPLPVESGDDVWVAEAPGWLVSGTRVDGIVRVANHGTDHAVEGSRVGDSPLYTRFGYSTATAPLMSAAAWASPADQSVVLVDEAGRATHRAGMRTLRVETVGDGPDRIAVGASAATAHWLDADPDQRDHGSGRAGAATDAGVITTVSVVRGPWEVRCVRVDPVPDAPEAPLLRVGGWPLSADEPVPVTATATSVSLRSGGLTSVLSIVDGFAAVAAPTEDDASPLGAQSRTPCATGPVAPGRWCVAVLALTSAVRPPLPHVAIDRDAAVVHVDWPGGIRSAIDLPRPETR